MAILNELHPKKYIVHILFHPFSLVSRNGKVMSPNDHWIKGQM